MLIGRDKIREIVERTDLVALIGRYVQLKRAGRSFRGLCPFHGERSPSFYVTPERQSYKCFGCQKGGDAIRFVMEYEGKDFVTAVRDLAQQAGVEIVFDPEEDRRLQERRQLLWACDVAAAFFEENLWSEVGASGRAHLLQRGVSEAVAKEARLGHAPMSWQALRDRFLRDGVPLEAGLAAGLLGKRDRERPGQRESDAFYDVFRGRLMVPIRDPEGRVIAFGGRVVEGDDDRKYINTRETSLYVKSRVLYGLDTAREAIRRSSEATLVEGYFDAIALREVQIQNVVALCSTVLTPEHIGLLQRLEVAHVNLLLDGDEAGKKAAVRLAGPLLAAGLSTRVIELPGGHDPDTFLREHGREGYDRLQVDAPALSHYVIQRALGGAGEGYEDRLRALAEMRPVVAALPEGAARTLFLGEIGKSLGLGAADIAAYFRGDLRKPTQEPERHQGHHPYAAGAHAAGAQGRGAGVQFAAHQAAGMDGAGSQRTPMRRGPDGSRDRVGGPAPANRRELELVANLVAHSEARREFGPLIAARLSHPGLRELVGLLVEGSMSEEELFSSLEPPLAQALATRVKAAWGSPERDVKQELHDGLLHVDFERLQEERRGLISERDQLAQQLARAGDPEEYREIESAIHEFGAQLATLREEMERLREQLRSTA